MIAMEPFRSRKASIPILDQVRDYCARHGLIEYGDRILLAVSGGPDSTAMLHMLHGLRLEYDLGLGVAHVHHGLRGFDADKDLRFVKGMARELDLPFYATKVQVLSQRNRCESLEEAARRLRYQFLLNTLQEMDYTKIAAGHTLEDNIETILYRLATGTGPGGAVGIYPKSGLIIHPLLALSKDRILEYLRKNGIHYRVDQTNDDRGIPRNRIRHEILPLFFSINQRYREHFGHFSEVLRGENTLLDRLAREALSTVLECRNDTRYRLEYDRFMQLDTALRRRIAIIVHEYLANDNKQFGRHYLPFKVLDLIATERVQGNRIIYENSDVTVRKEYDWLVFEKRVVNARPEGYLYSVSNFDEPQQLSEIGRELVFDIQNNKGLFEKGNRDREKIYLNYDKITLPLIVRSRREGDRIALRHVGHKKLKDLFMDQKVEVGLRACVPVLECNNEVIGVFCSFYGKDNRVSENYMITDGTEHVLVGKLRDWKR
ncbi:MAG: hypothetical protein AMS17_14625 [Spirochaetes bacterium DG_61]|nr:MAG: hypothetical protein AMS17_14625 [Spirochaetes bacterium DG_61]